MRFDPNNLFSRMISFIMEMQTKEFFVQGINNGKGGYTTKRPVIVNMGGTRSAKTWDFFSLLMFYCSKFEGEGMDIRVFRNTLDDCRQKTYKDFKECLSFIGVFDQTKTSGYNDKPKYNLFGNTITFMGIPEDENIEGFACDICFFNEVLETSNENFVNGMIDRVRRFSVMDSNPSKTVHFAFNYEHRDNVLYTHTTWRDNKHLTTAQIAEITKYSPYIDEDIVYSNNELYYKGEPITKQNHPPINEYNVKNGTINERRWRIYDKGCQGSVDGVIFNKVEVSNYTPKIPYSYGMDYGFTNDATSLTRNWEDAKNIYVELLIYNSFDNPQSLSDALLRAGLERNVSCVCDSSDTFKREYKSTVRMTKDLRDKGWKNLRKVNKTKTNAYWLQKMNEKTIVIIKNDIPAPDWAKKKFKVKFMWEVLRMEFSGYVWLTKGELSEMTPDPKCHDHAIDSVKYRFMGIHNKYGF